MFENYREFFFSVNNSDWDHVAKNMVPADYWCTNGATICSERPFTWEFYIKHYLHGNRTHAILKGYLTSYDLAVMPEKKSWWRSKKIEYGLNPYGAVLTSRNWILNEVNFKLL